MMQKDAGKHAKTGGWRFEGFAGDDQLNRMDRENTEPACRTSQEDHDKVLIREHVRRDRRAGVVSRHRVEANDGLSHLLSRLPISGDRRSGSGNYREPSRFLGRACGLQIARLRAAVIADSSSASDTVPRKYRTSSARMGSGILRPVS